MGPHYSQGAKPYLYAVSCRYFGLLVVTRRGDVDLLQAQDRFDGEHSVGDVKKSAKE